MRTSRSSESGPRKTKVNIFMRKKLALTYLVTAAVLFALALVLISINRKKGDEYARIVLAQQGYTTGTTAYRRGSVTDRSYTVLAYSEEVYNLILDPSVILYTIRDSNPSPNKNCTLDVLVACYGFDRADLEAVLAEKPDSAYVRYARQLTEEEKNVFLEYQDAYNNALDAKKNPVHSDIVTGVWFEKEYKRVYPYNTLAATILGFSGAEASEGHWGLEEYYNDLLTGTEGKTYSYMNSDGYNETGTVDPVGGYTIVSTIDYSLQRIVEEEIAAYVKDNPCANLGVIVMDPTNGEILAMATDKVFDPNDPMDLSYSYDAETTEAMSEEEKNEALNRMWRNFAVNDAYVPGSTVKELTVAMALEENKVTPDTVFVCDGGETVQGVYIRCGHSHGAITLKEGLMESCNEAMMNIAGRFDVATFLRYQREMGLGSRTGIDLPGEAAGLLFDESNMTMLDMATSSFGQGFSSNMVQVAAAYASLINGGYYYQPHIVRQILDENGALIRSIDPVLVRQTVTEKTSAFLLEAARDTVLEGTAGDAQIAGYSIGGKTGTAQKYPLEDNNYVISFMGFSPAEKPSVLIYVVIDEPSEQKELEDMSAHDAVVLERKIMERALPVLSVWRDRSQIPPETEALTEEVTETGESGEETETDTGAAPQ